MGHLQYTIDNPHDMGHLYHSKSTMENQPAIDNPHDDHFPLNDHFHRHAACTTSRSSPKRAFVDPPEKRLRKTSWTSKWVAATPSGEKNMGYTIYLVQ